MQTQDAAHSILDTARSLTQLADTECPLHGTLRITVLVEIADFWLPAQLGAFRARHPHVVLDIDVTDLVMDLIDSLPRL